METMHMIKINRDDECRWGYDKTFDTFISIKKESALLKVVNELKNIVATIKGRESNTKILIKDIEKFLVNFNNENRDSYTHSGEGSYFNKETNDIVYYFEHGNDYLIIEIVTVKVDMCDGEYSLTEVI